MQIDAVKFVLDKAEDGLQSSMSIAQLDTARPENIEALKRKNMGVAYVIQEGDRAQLTRHTDIVQDKGTKHKEAGLYPAMLGCKKIPVITGEYIKDGRVMRGVNNLVQKADKAKITTGEANIYFVCIREDVFKALFRRAAKGISDVTSPRKIKKINPVNSAQHSDSLVAILNVIVPKKLENSYVGDSQVCQLVRKLIMKAAESKEPVLIIGPTGTGKEIVAQAIHEFSGRTQNDFHAINCSAIPVELFENIMYGSEKGVYTGAVKDRKGMVEYADSGTLFLDEIGDLALQHQAKILRFLQEGTFRPIGALQDATANVRIIAATNKDLSVLCQTGQFREDLYYRLRGIPIRTPALSEHPEDIRAIANYLWKKIAKESKLTLTEDILRYLESYSWPGNVQQLKMVLMTLYSFFWKETELSKSYIKAIFAHQGIRLSDTGPLSSEAEREKIKSIEYLRRVLDVIKAVQIEITPLLDKSIGEGALHRIQVGLQDRLFELDLLLHGDAHRFTIRTFETVTRLSATLLFCINLMKKDPHAAIEQIRENGSNLFASAMDSINEEIKRYETSLRMSYQ